MNYFAPADFRNMKRFYSILLIFVCLNSNAQLPSFLTDSLDSYINQGLKDWDIPGLSLVIVKDGKVVLMKGYGVRNLTTKALVDEHTLFMIASNTKLFTGTALALLDEQGKIWLQEN